MTVVQLRPKIGQMIYRDFMDAGYRIFPLYRFKSNGACECGDPECEAVSKHPRASNWQNTPPWDAEQMESMEEYGFFDTGYGVLCRGLLVVDVDARNGGIESYERLKKEIPAIDTPGLTVYTGSGGGSCHLYFRAPADVSLVTHLSEYPGIDFKSSGYVVGPGSGHKSGGIYEADGFPEDIGEAPDELISLLRRPDRHRSEFNGHAVDVSHSDVADMLSYIINNDVPYDEWIAIGMAVHHATQGTGYDLWEKWSMASDKHDDSRMQLKWHSFGRSANPITIGTLIHHAQIGGWVQPVCFAPDQRFNDEASGAGDGLPFDITGVDLTQPPGFVGDVANWIDSQSFRPRKNLSVAAALVVIGNIGGLRYIDDVSGVTANLFAFCIAGSRTGKDAVLKGAMAVMRAAGVDAASHGTIKSEQEIVKNLIRHQASFYMVDEVAHFFSKIMNAQSKGGAHYLEGIPAMLMASYSKADDFLGVSGDVKDALKKEMRSELSAIEKSMDADGEKPFLLARKETLTRAIDNIDHGIERPFVSLMGVTVPNKFEMMMSKDMATNGFIGRSLVFHERETVPKARKDLARTKLPDQIANYVRAIWSGGEYDSMAPMRVENYDEPWPVPTEARAREMLSSVMDWMEEQAEARKETEMESLYLGGYEIVSKVSLILSIPERLRTAEHVRWAFALVKRDIEEKIREVIGNDSIKHDPSSALQARIVNLASKEGGEKEGVILARLGRLFKREDVLAALSRMTDAKRLTCEEGAHPRNRKPYRLYSAL